ncbi:hypothetical protein V2J09_011481, partial [Rumex salicifolius]
LPPPVLHHQPPASLLRPASAPPSPASRLRRWFRSSSVLLLLRRYLRFQSASPPSSPPRHRSRRPPIPLIHHQLAAAQDEIQQQTMSLIYLGILEENVLQKHIEGVQGYCGLDPKVHLLASKYVQKLGMIIKRSTHELDLDDEASIQMWVKRNKKSIFFYQDSSVADSFILGIQTERQLQQMIRYGHDSLMAYPLSTLLVFDSKQHALPVAWIISHSSAKPDVSKWMKALVNRVHAVDTATEIDPIRQEILSLVISNIHTILPTAKCVSGTYSAALFCFHYGVFVDLDSEICDQIQVLREIFQRLGNLVYNIWTEEDFSTVLQDFMQGLVNQSTFMQYFKDNWLSNLLLLYLPILYIRWTCNLFIIYLISGQRCGFIL